MIHSRFWVLIRVEMALIWLTVAFFGGIVSADWFPWKLSRWWLAAALGAVVISGLYRMFSIRCPEREFPLPLGLTLGCLICFVLGAVRYRSELPDFEDPAFILNYAEKGEVVYLTGRVIGFPDRRDQTVSARVQAERLRRPGEILHQQVEGKTAVRVNLAEEFHFGDRVVLKGELTVPPDDPDFSYRNYLARQGVYAYMPRARLGVLEEGSGRSLLGWIYQVREKALRVNYQLWPDPEASLLSGILLGIESGIPEPVNEAFKNTGTSHIIAISGFNITIIAGLFIKSLGKILPPGKTALAAGTGILFYTLLVGADPAVVRAAIMGGTVLLARQIGRRQHGINALALASFLMGLHNPQIFWDVSFQLSLAATLGLVLYAEPLTRGFSKMLTLILSPEFIPQIIGPISEYFLFTIAAQLTTFPILVYHFNRFSLISFVVNPLILPLQPPVMVLGGIAVLLGMVWFPLGRLTSPFVFPFIFLTIRIVEWFGNVPGGILDIALAGSGWVFLWYLTLFGFTWGASHIKGLMGSIKPALLLSILGMAVVLVWRMISTAPDGYLHLSFLDVGTGSAVLVTSPEGKKILINGGPAVSLLSNQLGRETPPFHREIDLLLIGSPQQEDIGGVAGILDRYPPSRALWVGAASPSRAADFLRSGLQDREIPVLEGDPGSEVWLGDEIRLTVLSETRRGGTLLLEYQRFRALLPFGIDDESREKLGGGRLVGPVTLYLLADNGRQESNPRKWMDNINPRLIILSVASDDDQGLPDRALLDRLGGYSLLRTDHNGTISIITDGNQMWVEVESGPR